MNLKPPLLLTLILFLFLVNESKPAVISIDAGAQFIKVGFIKRGKIDIALNKETNRKTPAILTFHDDTRHYGDSAKALFSQYPENSFMLLSTLLGQQLESEAAINYQLLFPYHKIGFDKEKHSITIHVEAMKEDYTVEELYSMILKHVFAFTREYAGESVYEVVLIVPMDASQMTRRAFLNSADLAGIKISQLMSDNTAVAANYIFNLPVSKLKEPEHYIFFDVGSTHAQSTVVSYKSILDGLKDIHQVKTIYYDRKNSIGGIFFDKLVMQHLLYVFVGQKPNLKAEILSNERVKSRLLLEANKAVITLSANDMYKVFIQNLYEDYDFSAVLKRGVFLGLVDKKLVEIAYILENTLDQCQLMDIIPQQVILMGGSSRIPRLQQLLNEKFNKPMFQVINTDEAAALGGVYRAAVISKTVRINPVKVIDAYPMDVFVKYNKSIGQEYMSRKLFSKFNKVPSRKSIVLSNRDGDFYVKLAYKNFNILSVKISDIEKAVTDMDETGAEYNIKGVKAYFLVDDSGIVGFDKCEMVFNVTNVNVEKEEEMGDVGDGLGWIGSIFGGGNKTDDGVEGIESGNGEGTADGNDEGNSDSNVGNDHVVEGSLDIDESESGLPDLETNKTSTSENVTDININPSHTNTTSKNSTQVKIPLPKYKIKRIVLKATISSLNFIQPEALDFSRIKIEKLDEHDENVEKVQKISNEIQTSYYDAKYKFEDDDSILNVTDADERVEILEKLSEINDWVDESMYENIVSYKDYQDKLSIATGLLKPIYERAFQYKHKTEGIEAMRSFLSATKEFRFNYTDYVGQDKAFSEKEDVDFLKLIDDSEKWLNDTIFEQESLSFKDEPVLKIEDIGIKIAALKKQAKKLTLKLKNYDPPKDPKEALERLKTSITSARVTIESFQKNIPQIDAITKEYEKIKNVNATVNENDSVDENLEIKNEKKGSGNEIIANSTDPNETMGMVGVYDLFVDQLNKTIVETENWILEKASNSSNLPLADEIEKKIEQVYNEAAILSQIVGKVGNKLLNSTESDFDQNLDNDSEEVSIDEVQKTDHEKIEL